MNSRTASQFLRCSFALLVVALGASRSAWAAVRHVIPGGAGLQDGSNWANAYPSFQAALAELNTDPTSVTEIQLGRGTYKPTSASASFSVENPCLIKGGFRGDSIGGSPTDWNPEILITRLSGDLTGNDDGTLGTMSENAFHVIVIGGDIGESSEDEAVELIGLRIEGGNATLDTGLDPEAPNGGGILWPGFSLYQPNLFVTDCRFSGNWAVNGGAIRASFAKVYLRKCVFEENIAIGSGPSNPASSTGGAVYSTGEIEVVECAFTANEAREAGKGGAVAARGGAGDSILITNSTFKENAAGTAAEEARGGAVYSIYRAPLTITGCVFVGNISTGKGGALGEVFDAGTHVMDVRLSTFVGNSAAMAGGAIQGTEVRVTNSILVENLVDEAGGYEAQVSVESEGTIDIRFSCVEGIPDPEEYDNIDEEPLFVNREEDNWRLTRCSPGVDVADDTEIPDDVTNVDLDVGTVELPWDRARNDRSLGIAVDMGAYETKVLKPCPADFNDDGEVNGDDLGALLGAWGPCVLCDEDVS